jgi:hypothetical protein
VHNRGVVNETYVARVQGLSEHMGKPLELKTNQVFDDVDFLSAAVRDIDERIAAKFSLVRVKAVKL